MVKEKTARTLCLSCGLSFKNERGWRLHYEKQCRGERGRVELYFPFTARQCRKIVELRRTRYGEE